MAGSTNTEITDVDDHAGSERVCSWRDIDDSAGLVHLVRLLSLYVSDDAINHRADVSSRVEMFAGYMPISNVVDSSHRRCSVDGSGRTGWNKAIRSLCSSRDHSRPTGTLWCGSVAAVAAVAAVAVGSACACAIVKCESATRAAEAVIPCRTARLVTVNEVSIRSPLSESDLVDLLCQNVLTKRVVNQHSAFGPRAGIASFRHHSE